MTASLVWWLHQVSVSDDVSRPSTLLTGTSNRAPVRRTFSHTPDHTYAQHKHPCAHTHTNGPLDKCLDTRAHTRDRAGYTQRQRWSTACTLRAVAISDDYNNYILSTSRFAYVTITTMQETSVNLCLRQQCWWRLNMRCTLQLWHDIFYSKHHCIH